MSENNDKIENVDENLDDSNVVTLAEVLDQQNELENECVAVLGASDDKCCTYAKGYIKRQALYSCLTCTPESRTDPTKSAGVCLACSYNCHDGHEMIELYTKRNFRCDCGIGRLSTIKCNLDRLKFEQNDKNLYNQNFSGVYCVCHRPYPDPEDPIDDEMIQCVVCEDWFHCRHLIAKVPSMPTFTEMICHTCTKKNEHILSHYMNFSVSDDQSAADESKVDEDDNEQDANVTIEEENDEKQPEQINNITNNDTNLVNGTKNDVDFVDKKPAAAADDDVLKDEINQCIADIIEINKHIGDSNDESNDEQPPTKRQKLSVETTASASIPIDAKIESSMIKNPENCKKPIKSTIKIVGDTFWPVDWRTNICNCAACMIELKAANVEFLIDLEDTVFCYINKGLAKTRESQYDTEMKALSRMNHVQKVDVIMGYNKMKEKLTEFLNAFVTNKQVVTEDDINRFFRMLNDKKEGGGAGGSGSTKASL